jgi:hypothetical protein
VSGAHPLPLMNAQMHVPTLPFYIIYSSIGPLWTVSHCCFIPRPPVEALAAWFVQDCTNPSPPCEHMNVCIHPTFSYHLPLDCPPMGHLPPSFYTQTISRSPSSLVCTGLHQSISPSQMHEHMHPPCIFIPSTTQLDPYGPSPTVVSYPDHKLKP